MEKDIAIKVEHLGKTFRIPHEKVSSLRGAFVGIFRGKRTYEEFKALDDVSFEIKKGEFFGIIGRNGSGKSTLLKILAGIYQPDRGRVHVNGMISPFLELGIGFNPELSGRDNVYLNATVLGMTKKQIDEKFDDIVKFSELERFIDQKLKNYSSGMQVRLAFSVSIHANRDILLMDEVLAVGDSNFQAKCLEEFNKYREMGKTVVLVSHDVATVRKYCDRVMLVRNGKIKKIGAADDVVSEYMCENISDENDRLVEKKTDEISSSRKKEKIVEITKVEFLDKNEHERSAFETGETVSVRVSFKIHEHKERFNFGLGLYNLENNYILGINTVFDSIETKPYLEKGYFQVDFNDISLNSNSYYILAGIGGNDFNVLYDLLPKSHYFRVISNSKHEGIVRLDYGWK